MIRNHLHIPVEILIDIIKRINDLNSLIRLRSVSKAWKSLIDSKDFIAAQTAFLVSHPETQRHRLLVRYGDLDKSGYKYISFVDDDRFRHDQKVTLFAPDSLKLLDLKNSRLVGSSHGLFCFYDTKTTDMAVIWNPSIRKSVTIDLPNVFFNVPYKTCVGFGVCPRTLDPKLVKIKCLANGKDLGYVNSGIPHQVEVFTLSSGSWRSPLTSNLPRESISFGDSQAVIDGFIYWDASVTTIVDGKSKLCNLVMSFDLSSEEFREHDLPDGLAYHHGCQLKVSKLRESLVVIEVSLFSRTQYGAVWMMTEHGSSRSFKIAKQFTIGSPGTRVYRGLGLTKPGTRVYRGLGLTKTGAPIIEIKGDLDKRSYKLSVYEPCSQRTNDIGLYGIGGVFFLNSYVETLILLDHWDWSMYSV